jgi:hypothetical protein
VVSPASRANHAGRPCPHLEPGNLSTFIEAVWRPGLEPLRTGTPLPVLSPFQGQDPEPFGWGRGLPRWTPLRSLKPPISPSRARCMPDLAVTFPARGAYLPSRHTRHGNPNITRISRCSDTVETWSSLPPSGFRTDFGRATLVVLRSSGIPHTAICSPSDSVHLRLMRMVMS